MRRQTSDFTSQESRGPRKEILPPRCPPHHPPAQSGPRMPHFPPIIPPSWHNHGPHLLPYLHGCVWPPYHATEFTSDLPMARVSRNSFRNLGAFFRGKKFLEIWVCFQRFQVSPGFSRFRGFITLKITDFEKVSRIIILKITDFEKVSRIISLATFGPE